MIDKGGADLQGNVGEYHFACPICVNHENSDFCLSRGIAGK
jgi:hypothetical protein